MADGSSPSSSSSLLVGARSWESWTTYIIIIIIIALHGWLAFWHGWDREHTASIRLGREQWSGSGSGCNEYINVPSSQTAHESNDTSTTFPRTKSFIEEFVDTRLSLPPSHVLSFVLG